MDLRNYEVTGDETCHDLHCDRCQRIVASTDFDEGRLPDPPTLADLLAAATRHEPAHRTARV